MGENLVETEVENDIIKTTMAKHHYVPQFYLRNFSPSISQKDIIVYKRKDKPFRSNIINVASSNDFYSLKDEKTGIKDDTIEKFFSQLEGATKPIIEKIIQNKSINLTDDERITLTHFLGFLYVRNQNFRQKTKNLYSAIMKQMMAFSAHNKEHFNRSLKKATKEDLTEKQLEDTREFALKGEYEIGYKDDDHFIGATLSLAKDIMPIFWGKNWKIITTDSSRVFATSDNPLAIAPPRNHIKNPFGGLGLLEADIYLPISPSMLLFFTNNEEWPETIVLNRAQVDSINTMISKFAQKFMFANLESKDISNLLDKTNESDSTKIYIGNSFLEK